MYLNLFELVHCIKDEYMLKTFACLVQVHKITKLGWARVLGRKAVCGRRSPHCCLRSFLSPVSSPWTGSFSISLGHGFLCPTSYF